MRGIKEIRYFWNVEIKDYDDIVAVKEIAYSDIYKLIDVIIEQEDKLDRMRKIYPDEFK